MRSHYLVPLVLLLTAIGCAPDDSQQQKDSSATGASTKLLASARLLATIPTDAASQVVPADISQVTLQVFWAGGSTPLLEVARTGDASYELVVGSLPANVECTIHAKALGQDDAVLYEGEIANIVFDADVQTMVILNMVAADNGSHEGTAPRIAAVRRPAAAVQTGSIVGLTFTVTDPDDDAIFYQLSAPGGSFSKPEGNVPLVQGSAAVNVEYTAPSVTGPVPITISVTDSAGLSTSFAFTLIIRDSPVDAEPTEARAVINFPPSIEGVTSRRTNTGRVELLATVADDGPAADLAYSWTREGQAIGQKNPVTLDASGSTFTVSLTVRDAEGASTSMSFDLNTTITTIWYLPIDNVPPHVVAAVKSLDDVSYGDTVDLTLYARDPDGDALAADWSADRGALDAISSEVQGDVTVFRAAWHAGETTGLNHVRVTVRDDRLAWVAYVFPINQVLGRVAITANAGHDASTLMGGSAVLDGSASASDDGKILSYEWTQVSGPDSTIDAPDQPVTAVLPTVAGTYRYRLTVSNVNNSASDEVVLVATDPLAFMFEDAFMADDSMIYFLDKIDGRIHRYELNAWHWLPPFETGPGLRTMAVAPEGNQVYVGYEGGRIDVIDAATGQKTFFANVATTVMRMAVADAYVFTIDSSGSWETFSLYSRATGQLTDSDDWRDYSAGIVYSRPLRCLFTFRDGTSPNDIYRTEVTDTGTLGTSIESPYHGAYSFTHPMRLLPDQTKIAVASGVLFSTTDLTYAGSVGTSYLDMTFYDNLPMVIKKIGTNTEPHHHERGLRRSRGPLLCRRTIAHLP